MIDRKFVDRLVSQALKDSISRYVVAAVIANECLNVLLLERPRDEFLGGIYELPSGKVEEGESLLEALYRETREETGMNIRGIKEYLGYFDYLSKSKKKTRQFNFHVEVEDISQITLSEHSSYVWVSHEDLNKYRITDNVKNVLKKFWGF
ncbi:MAG: DNA mismatch repair protein MutT [Candidatus Aenigmatarchaeota archaeon]|nr:MAG: DNA mismatch repair protein MutT [Candidatus Aenigmarchaeota archaeon]